MAQQKDNRFKVTNLLMSVTFFVVAAAFIVILAQAFILQVTEGDKYRKKIAENSQRRVAVPADRGDILARDGRKLACSVPSYRIVMDPCADGLKDSIFNKGISKLSVQLSNLFKDKSPEEYREKIEAARRRGSRYLRLGNRRISHLEYRRVKEFSIFSRGRNKGGFFVEQNDERKLPFGILAARTVGKLYEDKQKGGLVGLENSFDKVLRGKDGVANKLKMTGKWISCEVTPPVDGRSLLTTIDIDIQDVAENSMIRQLSAHNADHGVAMLMEVKTGAVRAIVNLHRQADGTYTEDHYNYAVGELAEPGSTFKLASLIACIEEGGVSLSDTIDTYNGEFKIYDRVMRDSKPGGHGNVTVQRAFELSSNIGMSRLVMKCFDKKRDVFIECLKNMGLADSLGLDVKGEGRSEIKTPADPTWSGTTLPWMSIGYEVRLTPIQLLTFYNAVANNGTMMRPMFVECQIDNGKRVAEVKPRVMRNSIARTSTIRQIQKALVGVVENGTAKNISGTPYQIAGKTGTAQIAHDGRGYKKDGEHSYLASFAGYFPADNPLYSVVVMVYGPSNNVYYGNVVAGNVVKAIADRVYAAEFRKGSGQAKPQVPTSGKMPYSKGGWAPDLVKTLSDLKVPNTVSSSSSDWVSATARADGVSVKPRFFTQGVVPSVIGMGAADAVSLLEQMGLVVSFEGVGRVVSQSIPQGSHFHKGTSISLTLEN
ncbi:MAG: penicillin-binding protein [Bacteroidales bacterium]|nr:penicillin-binding protein [Bacteroidales bacterium]MDY4174475.1 penicillin-binding protein [Bacteroidales bacterium]